MERQLAAGGETVIIQDAAPHESLQHAYTAPSTTLDTMVAAVRKLKIIKDTQHDDGVPQSPLAPIPKLDEEYPIAHRPRSIRTKLAPTPPNELADNSDIPLSPKRAKDTTPRMAQQIKLAHKVMGKSELGPPPVDPAHVETVPGALQLTP